VITIWLSPLSWAMENVRQHAVVASSEISEPGERLATLLAGDADGLLGTTVDTGFAVWLGAGDGAVAAWLAGMDIEP
jgi:hypothetical protein